jgi:hypothetical protein
MSTGPLISTAVNLDAPGRYLHWSIFFVSEANLVLIVVMVVIFGAALLLPFPGHAERTHAKRDDASQGDSDGASVSTSSSAASDLGDDADAAMWTSRMRRGPRECDVDLANATWSSAPTAAWQAPPRPPACLRQFVDICVRCSQLDDLGFGDPFRDRNCRGRNDASRDAS